MVCFLGSLHGTEPQLWAQANSGNFPEPTVDQRLTNVQDSHGPTFALQRTLPPRERWKPRRMDFWGSGSRQKDGKNTRAGDSLKKTHYKRGFGIFVVVVFFWMVREKKGDRMKIDGWFWGSSISSHNPILERGRPDLYGGVKQRSISTLQ